jgi:hypothetical protein
MKTPREPVEPSASTRNDAAPSYESPGILWEEPFATTVFGVSCAKQPGNPPCNTGPFSS